MATRQEERYLSATWWDVKVYCLEFGKAHNGYVSITAHFDLPDKVKKTALWQVNFWPRGRAVAEGSTWGVHDYMPHIDHVTVPDLLLRLIYDLDAKMTAAAQKKERQAHF